MPPIHAQEDSALGPRTNEQKTRTHRRTRCVVLGDTAVAERLAAALADEDVDTEHVRTPDDTRISSALTPATDWVAIMVHDDILALRYALACAHVRPGISIVVTIFDRTIGDEVHRMLEHCEVTSPAELALPHLVSLCMNGDGPNDSTPTSAEGDFPNRRRPDRVDPSTTATITRTCRTFLGTATTHLTGFARTRESGARILVVGLMGLLTVLGVDFLWLTLREHRSLSEGAHEAVRVVTTVGSAEVPHSPIYAVVAACAMLITVVFTAMFTAGIVDRSLGNRGIAMLGPRSMPRRNHVIVVGLGQVGARLCMQLRSAGIPVVAVERDITAPGLRLIRNLRIPTVVGHGVDRWLLEETRIAKAAALAAVGSNDLDNISVAVAAHGVAPGVRIVLRAGGHTSVGSDTGSLLPLGLVCDVTALTVDYVARKVLAAPHG